MGPQKYSIERGEKAVTVFDFRLSLEDVVDVASWF